MVFPFLDVRNYERGLFYPPFFHKPTFFPPTDVLILGVMRRRWRAFFLFFAKCSLFWPCVLLVVSVSCYRLLPRVPTGCVFPVPGFEPQRKLSAGPVFTSFFLWCIFGDQTFCFPQSPSGFPNLSRAFLFFHTPLPFLLADSLKNVHLRTQIANVPPVFWT